MPKVTLNLPPVPAVRSKNGALYVSHDALVSRLSTIQRHPDMKKATAIEALDCVIGWLLSFESFERKPAEENRT